jgi:transcriptional regulator with XRE-family HTH domain
VNRKAKRNQQESLAEFVKRTRADRKLSLNDVAAESGGEISNGYIWSIENGQMLCPSVRKLQALAKGLGISEDELNARSRGISEPDGFRESGFWELFREYQKLKKPLHKKTVDGYLRDLVRMMKALQK